MEELLRLATEVTVSHCCTMVGIYLSDWDIRQEGKSCTGCKFGQTKR